MTIIFLFNFHGSAQESLPCQPRKPRLLAVQPAPPLVHRWARVSESSRCRLIGLRCACMHHRSTCISCQEGCWRASLASASRLNTPSSLSLSLSHGTTVIAPHIAIPQPSPRISRQQSGRDNRLSYAITVRQVGRSLYCFVNTCFCSLLFLIRNNLEATEAAAIRGKRGVTSPETERERGVEAGGSASMDGAQKAAAAWPKLALSLTNKEKEEDFLVFKGSKLPQRPKKRAKLLQRTINVSSPFFFSPSLLTFWCRANQLPLYNTYRVIRYVQFSYKEDSVGKGKMETFSSFLKDYDSPILLQAMSFVV